MTRRHHIAALLIILALAIVLPALGRAQEQQPNRAGVVIRHGDGQVTTACVSFTEPEINGLTLLDRAGVSYLAQSGGIGAAVCKLDGEGCEYPTEDCFCHCKGAECVYWIYHHLVDGKWSYSQIGAGATRIQPGDVDGWVWGPGNLQTGAQPPARSFGQVCPAPSDDQQTAATEVAPAPPQPTEAPPPTPPPAEAPPAPTPPPTLRPTRTPQSIASPTAAPGMSASATAPASAPVTQEPRSTLAPKPTEAAQPTAGPAPATIQLATAVSFPTASPHPSPAPTATIAGAGGAAPTRVTAPATRRAGSGYLGFGILALILIGGIVAVLLRRRGQSR